MLARQYGITREQSDQFALESRRKAEAAQQAGHFTREIARHGSTIEALRKLPLTFPKVGRARRLATFCVSGGMGMAMAIETVSHG